MMRTGSLLALLAFIASSSGFDFKKVLPEYFPVVLTYSSSGRNVPCSKDYPSDGPKPYYDPFNCDGLADGTEICLCVSTYMSIRTPAAFTNQCGVCRRGIVPIDEHYRKFQDHIAWKRIIAELSDVNRTGFNEYFGPYRTMVLAPRLDVYVGTYDLLKNEVLRILDQRKDREKDHGAEFVTGLMAELAPFAQDFVNALRGSFPFSFAGSIKARCVTILEHWKALLKADVDAHRCVQTADPLPLGNSSSPSQDARSACRSLHDESRFFATVGAGRAEAAVPTCLVASILD